VDNVVKRQQAEHAAGPGCGGGGARLRPGAYLRLRAEKFAGGHGGLELSRMNEPRAATVCGEVWEGGGGESAVN
jgi:hypothetical protein